MVINYGEQNIESPQGHLLEATALIGIMSNGILLYACYIFILVVLAELT